jgi:hypothetical protein
MNMKPVTIKVPVQLGPGFVLVEVESRKKSIYTNALACVILHKPTHSSFLALHHFSIAFLTPNISISSYQPRRKTSLELDL